MDHLHHYHNNAGPSGIASFLIFGLLSSLHCFAMCGPLSAAFIANQEKKSFSPIVIYHLCRLTAYTLIAIPIQLLGIKLKFYWGLYPLLLIVTLLFLINLAGINIPGLKIPSFMTKSLTRFTDHFGPKIKACLIGLITPLLPCGLLYAVYTSILLAENSQQAMLWMLGFGLGSTPLLMASQLGWHALAARFKNSQIFFLLLGILALGGFLLMPIM